MLNINKVFFYYLLSAIYIFYQIECAHVQHHTNDSHPPDAGICTLEVPTVDLLTPDQKRGVIPPGNGTRPGFSKIHICCSGWKVKPHRAFRCEPICENDCDHGNCTAPNVCVCHKGYVSDPRGNCVPTCPIGCVNGVCTTHGVCSCNSGYVSDAKKQICLPYCSRGCGIGGDCIAPENCECRPGFEKTPSGTCEYHCDGGCQGGECIGPNMCSCKQGFTKVNNVCVAACPKGCTNGVCTGPNICTCGPGLTLDSTGTKCEASCNMPCLNADCTAPNVCTCRPGYIKDPSAPAGNRCIAHCAGGCENGQCSAPNFCICNVGFVKERKGSNKCIRRNRRSIHYELIPEQYGA